jgi:hypothetical protein
MSPFAFGMFYFLVVTGLPKQYYRIPGIMMGTQIETFLRLVK